MTVTDIEERDNKVMAESAKTIVEALSAMKAEGWVTDEIAISLAFKFAGEILSQEEIKRILEKAPEQKSAGNGGERASHPPGGRAEASPSHAWPLCSSAGS